MACPAGGSAWPASSPGIPTRPPPPPGTCLRTSTSRLSSQRRCRASRISAIGSSPRAAPRAPPRADQPLAEDDLLDPVRLQAQLKTALCLDESILSARIARQALEAGACRIINIKSGRVGGVAGAGAIHELGR